jgi:hypothetical protein
MREMMPGGGQQREESGRARSVPVTGVTQRGEYAGERLYGFRDRVGGGRRPDGARLSAFFDALHPVPL